MHSTKSENQTTPVSPNALKSWILAARPKTWPAAICPIAIGAAMAAMSVPLSFWILTLTLLFALFIQIGTNFANDYFDHLKGADTAERIGPTRAMQAGWISPSAMKTGIATLFSAALIAAIPLMIRCGIWSLGIASASIFFGIFYTAGKKPLGYLGLGDLLVIIFYGPVAVAGTYYLQTGWLDPCVWIASIAPALLSCAILIANNLRDEETDRVAHKKTLIVRFGRTFGACEYTLAIVLGALSPLMLVAKGEISLNGACASLVAIAAIPLIKKAFTFQQRQELVPLLPMTSLLFIIYTMLFCILR